MPGKSLRFGSFTLDLERLSLFGPSGQLQLRPKSFEVLRYLVEHAGRVVRKDEVIQAVWPNVSVTDESLTRCISEVRRAISDGARRIIRTVPRRGYLCDVPILNLDSLADGTAYRPGRESILCSSCWARLVDYSLPPADCSTLLRGLAPAWSQAAPRLDMPQERLRPLDDRPSIVVLPFTNLTGDPNCDYFADAITDAITEALSKWRWFFVISRNLAFRYRNTIAAGTHISKDLGVRYVLEGRVFRHNCRLRIAGQLSEACSGVLIWADRFEGALDDIFALQDGVAKAVTAAIEPQMRRAEVGLSKQKTENLTAYDYFIRALPDAHAMKQSSTARALGLLSMACAVDPNFAAAHALAAFSMMQRRQQGWTKSPVEDDAQAIDLAEKALDLDPHDPMVLWSAAHAISALGRDHARARTLLDRSLALNPNSAEALCISGWNHNYVGNGKAGLADFQRAIRLSPFDPMLYYFYTGISSAYMNLREYDLTIGWALKALAERPNYGSTLRQLAVGLAYSGKREQARDAIGRLLRLDPALTLDVVDKARSPLSDYEDRKRYLEGLRLAGLPKK